MNIKDLFVTTIDILSNSPLPALMAIVVLACLAVVGLALGIVWRCIERGDD